MSGGEGNRWRVQSVVGLGGILGLLATGCSQLQVASAGEVGCAPTAIEIGNVKRAWASESWTATCADRVYQCSSMATAYAIDYSCRRLESPSKPEEDEDAGSDPEPKDQPKDEAKDGTDLDPEEDFGGKVEPGEDEAAKSDAEDDDEAAPSPKDAEEDTEPDAEKDTEKDAEKDTEKDAEKDTEKDTKPSPSGAGIRTG